MGIMHSGSRHGAVMDGWCFQNSQGGGDFVKFCQVTSGHVELGQSKIFNFHTLTCYLLSAMKSSSTQSNMTTRAKNANTHPGQVVAKRKRRTKAEIKKDKQKAKEEKMSQQAITDAALKRIAELENQLAHQDANDTTPKPLRPLRRTKTFAQIPTGVITSEWLSSGDHTKTEDYIPSELTEISDNDEEDEEAPPKKTTKDTKETKPKIRDAIKDAGKESVGKESTDWKRGSVKEEGAIGDKMIVDKVGPGKKAHETVTRFVNTRSYLMTSC
jgi:hypothetical protein